MTEANPAAVLIRSEEITHCKQTVAMQTVTLQAIQDQVAAIRNPIRAHRLTHPLGLLRDKVTPSEKKHEEEAARKRSDGRERKAAEEEAARRAASAAKRASEKQKAN
ncbi:MAG: hypothetical protein K2X81_01505 [Candidatus Obscuribacterales bacterium]|nr:hypothetical protein [Candidatus Obscuribacterales bacterium]